MVHKYGNSNAKGQCYTAMFRPICPATTQSSTLQLYKEGSLNLSRNVNSNRLGCMYTCAVNYQLQLMKFARQVAQTGVALCNAKINLLQPLWKVELDYSFSNGFCGLSRNVLSVARYVALCNVDGVHCTVSSSSSYHHHQPTAHSRPQVFSIPFGLVPCFVSLLELVDMPL